MVSLDLELWAMQSWCKFTSNPPLLALYQSGFDRVIVITDDYLSILTLQGRSFCAWIVNKTWWDVTYDIIKYLDIKDNYYTVAFLVRSQVICRCLSRLGIF